MTRRRNPDSDFSGSPGPLWDAASAEAMQRAQERAEQAAGHAEKVEPGWQAEALETIRNYARTHSHFLAQDVPVHIPEDADPRAPGQLFPEARRRGWIKSDGTRLDKWGSHKTWWRSQLFNAASASPAASP